MAHGTRHPALTVPLIVLGLVLLRWRFVGFRFRYVSGVLFQGSVSVLGIVGPSRPIPSRSYDRVSLVLLGSVCAVAGSVCAVAFSLSSSRCLSLSLSLSFPFSLSLSLFFS